MAVIQTKDAAGAGFPTTLNFASAVSISNSVIVWIGDYNTNGGAIGSSAPTYNGSSVTGATKLLEVQNGVSGTSNVMYFAVWLLPNVQSSGTSVAVSTTNGSADTNSHYYIAEVSGLGTSPAADTASPNPKTASSPAGGAISSGATGNAVGTSGIVLGGMMQDGVNTGWTGPAGWITIAGTPSSYAGASYQIFSSSGSAYTWSATGSSAGQWAAGAVILAGASSSGASVTGVAASVSVDGGVGSVVATSPNVTVTGVGAAVTVDGGVGSVNSTTAGYSIWGVNGNGGTGPGTSLSLGGGWTGGNVFEVTSSGYQITGYGIWCAGDGSMAASTIKFALWQATGAGTGTLVSGSEVTLGTQTAGAWVYVSLPTPIALTSGQVYKVQVGTSNSQPWEANYWTAAGANGFTNGPLHMFSTAGGTDPDSYSDNQSTYTWNNPGPSDPASGYVNSQFNDSNVWADVVIQSAGTDASVTGVAASVSVDGGIGSLSGIGSASVAGVAAEIIVAVGSGYSFEVSSSGTSGGVTTYTTFSGINNTSDAGSQDMRVLPPDSPNTDYDHAFLWMLPVEPGQGTTFGDSIATIQDLNAHNNFNLTCIQPGFPINPWYGNNVDDPQTQQVTFLLKLVEWANQNLATTGTEKHYLIGFSKSGFGGQTVFLQHQDIFSGVISWDTACDLQLMTDYGSDPDGSFGEQSQLDDSILYDPNLTAWKALGDTGTVNRIQLAAGINLITPTSDYADRLTAAGIMNTYTFVETDVHSWAPTPGWVEPALVRLLGADSGIVTGVAAAVSVDGGIGSLSTSVKTSGVGASVSIAGGIGAASTGTSAHVTGIGASITVAGAIGSATSTTSARITGVGASISVDGGIGTVQAGGAGTVIGVGASISVAGGVGSVTASSPNAVVTGTAAIVQVFGGIGVPNALAAKYYGHSAISGTANGNSTTTLTQPYSSAQTGSI